MATPKWLWPLMTVGTGVSVAGLYYLQPLLDSISREWGIKPGALGFCATLVQIGYALGMLLVTPMGDFWQRRSMIAATAAASALALFAVGLSRTPTTLGIAAFCLGFVTVTPQLIVPMAAVLSAPETRGKNVGRVMSGLIVGILGARAASGALNTLLGWRLVFLFGGCLTLLMGGLLLWKLPKLETKGPMGSYPQLMASLLQIWREEPILRQSCLIGAVSFSVFSAFWTTHSFLMGPGYSSTAVGAMSLLGIVGAMGAPLTGRLADKGGALRSIQIGFGLLLISVAMIYGLPVGLITIGVGIILLDFAAQMVHISNQARNYALRPEASSRINTLYMTTYFMGGSIGAGLASLAWTAGGAKPVWMLTSIICLGGLALGTYLHYTSLVQMSSQDPVSR